MTVITDVQNVTNNPIDVTKNSTPSDPKIVSDNLLSSSDVVDITKLDLVPNTANNQVSFLDSSRVTITTNSDNDEDNYSSEDDSDIYSNNDNALQQLENGVPSFASVSVVNSSEVHFGNKTVYQGPVTIKQFVYPNGSQNDAISDVEKQSAYDNRAFSSDSDVSSAVNDTTEKNNVVISDEADKKCAERRSKLDRGFIWLQNIPKQRPLEIGIFLTIIILSLSILLLVLFWKHPAAATIGNVISLTDSDEQDKILPVDYQNELSNTSVSNKLHIVTRQQWVAQPPVQPINPLPTPVSLVIIHHTATENCSSQAQCVFHVRYIQTFHIESNDFWDIGYNFLVGGDGNAYEGRGWKEEGAHTFGYNKRSIGIAFIGSFLKVKPPLRQLLACKKLIEKGVELGYISKDFKILAVRQLRPTESPGLALFEEIKMWPHWSEEP